MTGTANAGGLPLSSVSNKKKPLIASGTSAIGLLLIIALLAMMRRRSGDGAEV